MKIAILTSYPLDVRAGSGVIRTLEGLCSAFKTAGNSCCFYHLKSRWDYTDLTNLRLEYNNYLKELDLSSYDLVIGSDFDGWMIDVSNLQDYVVFNGGVLADVVRFESGAAKDDLISFAGKEKINLQKARLILAPSLYAAERIHSLYEIHSSKIKITPLGIDVKKWDLLLSNAVTINNGIKNILCVAKQYSRKGTADLIKAFVLVSREYPEARLVIVGDGPEFKNNQNLTGKLGIDSKIIFTGDIADKTKLAAYYKNSAVFCLPSYHETFGLVLLEAMASGLPIVTYKAAAIPEVVSAENAILVDPGNIDRLASGICQILGDKKLAEGMAEKSRAMVQGMSWQKSAELFLETCTLK